VGSGSEQESAASAFNLPSIPRAWRSGLRLTCGSHEWTPEGATSPDKPVTTTARHCEGRQRPQGPPIDGMGSWIRYG
jgi:hypothetical protein